MLYENKNHHLLGDYGPHRARNLGGGVTDLAQGRASVVSGPFVADVITHLGYPVYLLTILGVWKLAGGVTLLVPGFPRLKEWAYADRKSTRLNSSHSQISYAVFCLKKKKRKIPCATTITHV